MMSWANARILMTTDAVGGVWTYSTALAAALAARGYQILLVTLGPRPHADQLAAISRCPGVEVITTERELEWIDPEGRDIAGARKALNSVASRFKPDLVHPNCYHGARAAGVGPV